MEIGLTSRMRKQCKITKLPESTQENLFYSWDVNIDKYKNRNVLFIANANNRLGCIICSMKPSAYKNLTDYVTKWIRELLLLQGYTEIEVAEYMTKAGEPLLTKTHGKKAICAMNQAFPDVIWSDYDIDGSEELQMQINIWINEILGKSAGYNDEYYHPCNTFMQDMENAGVEVEQAKYVVIRRITKDDHGCEERPEVEPPVARCFVVSMDGKTREWVRIPESVLAEKGLDEGSRVERDFIDKYK